MSSCLLVWLHLHDVLKILFKWLNCWTIMTSCLFLTDIFPFSLYQLKTYCNCQFLLGILRVKKSSNIVLTFYSAVANIICNDNKILCINCLHDEDILRVNRRISNANVSHEFKHPAILPKNCYRIWHHISY